MKGFLFAGWLAAAAAPAAAADFRVAPESLAALTKRTESSAIALRRADGSSITLRELSIYAPGARIIAVDPNGQRELPRSDWRHFIPAAHSDSERVTVSISPDGRTAVGTLFADDGNTYPLRGRREKSGALTFERGERATAEGFQCDNTAAFEKRNDWRVVADEFASTSAGSQAKAGSRTAVVAVDTDFELLDLKFAGNTTNATNYLAALFAAMNVIYERDLDLTLLQGTTFLRTDVADPYPSTSATSTNNQLDEFSEYWRVTYPAENRAFAMQVSGKSGSNNSASGIAWVGSASPYCGQKGQTFSSGSCADGTCTFGHYSVSRVFKFNGATAANDVLVTAHELGHNFGLSHTHCTDAATGNASVTTGTIDACYNTESGCYNGAKLCPAPTTVNGVTNVTGTLMSYCHLSGLANCGSSLVFADRNRQTLLPLVANNVTAGCFSAAAGNPPVIFLNGFE